MAQASVSLGVAGTLGPAAIARVAAEAEAAGFAALWVNDTPGGDSLAALAAAAEATGSLTLATGVLPLDRRPAGEIAQAVVELALPQERLVLGVGAGGAGAGALDLVRRGVAELRGRTSARVMVGALGPRMRRLAAVDADGPLLSWLTPVIAAQQADEAHGEASRAHVALYVRTALDPAAGDRLADEAARYAGYPRYAANFERLGLAAGDTVIAPDASPDLLERYRGAVEEVVLRAITPGDAVDDYLRFVAEAAERLSG